MSDKETIVVFGPNKAFFCANPDGSWFSTGPIPKGFQDRMTGDGQKLFWASIGPNGQYYISWNRDGRSFRHLENQSGNNKNIIDRLRKYDSKDKKSRTKVMFGPSGSYWLRTDSGWRASSIQGLEDKINDKQDKHGAPKHVSIGYNDSWVVIFEDGRMYWDLKGQYDGLYKKLKDANDGDFKAVFLNPWDRGEYVVGKKNGGKSWHLSSDWGSHIRF